MRAMGKNPTRIIKRPLFKYTPHIYSYLFPNAYDTKVSSAQFKDVNIANPNIFIVMFPMPMPANKSGSLSYPIKMVLMNYTIRPNSILILLGIAILATTLIISNVASY